MSSVPIKRPRGRPRRVRPDENVVPEKDLTNFIHLSSAPDFSFLDPTALFLDYCKEINFDPYNIPADIQPLKRWNERRTIRPRETTGVIGMNLDPATEKHKEEIALQLLPLNDPRRKFVAKQFAMYNTASMKRSRRHYRLFAHPDVHWINRFIGNEKSSYGPGEVEIFGIEALVAYNECTMRLVPDAWHHCYRSDIYLLLDGSVTLVFHHMVFATKVFRSPAERFQKVVVHEDCTAWAYEESGDTSSVTSVFSLKTLMTNQNENDSDDDDDSEEDEVDDDNNDINKLEYDSGDGFASSMSLSGHQTERLSNPSPSSEELPSVHNHTEKRYNFDRNSEITFQGTNQTHNENSSHLHLLAPLDENEGVFPNPSNSAHHTSPKTISSMQEEGESHTSMTNLELLNQQLLPAESTGLSVTTIVFYSKPNEQKFYKVRLIHSGRF